MVHLPTKIGDGRGETPHGKVHVVIGMIPPREYTKLHPHALHSTTHSLPQIPNKYHNNHNKFYISK